MSLPEAMSGVLMTAHGGPECLSWREDLPLPRVGPGDVLIRVAAAGVNNTDINTRIGWYAKTDDPQDSVGWSGAAFRFPRIQGADICGHIAAVGPGVSPGRIGARVLVEPCLQEANGQMLESPWYIGSECDGGFAQYVRVAARHAYEINCDLSDVELASFPCSYSTAENMLTRANVSRGDRVLVTGASGGVGSGAIQLARARGAEIIAVTSPAKADSLRALGAKTILNRDDDYLAVLGNNSVDVVIDLVAGPEWPKLFEVLRPKGRYAVAGAIGGAMVTLDVRTLYLKDLSFFGCTVLEPQVFGNLVERIESGQIKPLVAETFTLKDIGAAQEAFSQKGYTGKIVLTVA